MIYSEKMPENYFLKNAQNNSASSFPPALPSCYYARTKSFLLPTKIQSFKFCQSFSSGMFPSYFLY